MVALNAQIKRAILNSLFLQAQANATPLVNALNAFLLDGFSACQSGRLVVSHTGAGKQVTFQVPRIDQQFRQEEVFGLAQELTEVYTDALTTLGISQPTDASQDRNIFQTMLADDRLQEVTIVSSDFTGLGWPR